MSKNRANATEEFPEHPPAGTGGAIAANGPAEDVTPIVLMAKRPDALKSRPPRAGYPGAIQRETADGDYPDGRDAL